LPLGLQLVIFVVVRQSTTGGSPSPKAAVQAQGHLLSNSSHMPLIMLTFCYLEVGIGRRLQRGMLHFTMIGVVP
jgi:hypothetical protein